MIRIVDEAGERLLEVASFDAPLRKGLRFRVEPEGSLAEPGAEVAAKATRHFRLLDWEYCVRNGEIALFELTVQTVGPIKPKQPISDTKALVAMFLGVVVCVVLLIQFHAYYVNPDYFWSSIGHYARGLGIGMLLILFVAVLPSRLGVGKRATFRDIFLSAILFWTGIALIFLWCGFTRHPVPFGGTDADYVEFGRTVAEKLKLGNWPILLAALPWAAVVFKIFGFEVAEKTSEAVLKAARE